MKLIPLGFVKVSSTPTPLSTDANLRLANIELRAVKNVEDYSNDSPVYLGGPNVNGETGEDVAVIVEAAATWRFSGSALLANCINPSELFVTGDEGDALLVTGWQE